MALSAKQRKHLKALAHHRKPVVFVGNAGVTAAVIGEIKLALARHELIKIRLPGVARDERSAMVRNICETTRSDVAQEIGRVAVIYRPAAKPRIALPTG